MAKKPCKMTHSYAKAICQRIEIIRELIKGKTILPNE
jgi:Trp operon repressor